MERSGELGTLYMGPSQEPNEDDRESEWIRRMASGDELALEQMLRAYNQRLAGYLCKGMGFFDHRDREEIVSAWAMQVFTSAHTFRGESRPFVWAISVLRNVAMNHLRKYGKRQMEVDLPPNTASGTQKSPEGRIALKDALDKGLSELSDKSREALLMAADGLSAAEIKRVQNDLLEGNVRKRIHRNRKHLREILGKWGFESP